MILPFPWQPQEQDNWCWAAVSSCVDAFFQQGAPPMSQCEIASAVLATACCGTSTGGICDRISILETPLQVVQHYRFTIGPPPSLLVEHEINGGRPVCVQIQWDTGENHFVTIFGFEIEPDGTFRYYVADPATEPEEVSEEELLRHYRERGRAINGYLLSKMPGGS